MYIPRVVGARVAVICKLKNVILGAATLKVRVLVSFARIASSMGVKDWAMVDMSLRRAPIATLGNIKKEVETVISGRCGGQVMAVGSLANLGHDC